MSFRLTFALLVILVAVGGYALLLASRGEQPPAKTLGATFYDLNVEKINRIAITYYGNRQVFLRAKPGDWRFETVDGLHVSSRFSGTNLLASGGIADRIVQESPTPEQLTEYGLEDPAFRMEVGVETGEVYHISLGKTTPDGQYNYAFNQADRRVFLMPQIWGEVLAEFVTNPPLPPTPTVPAEGTAP